MIGYLKFTTTERHPALITIAAHTMTHNITPLKRLQLPVDGISDGYANTNSAELLTSYNMFCMQRMKECKFK